MSEAEKTEHYQTQSKRSILISTLIAAVVATVVLVTVILPVEYGIDPTGIGYAIGLDVISEADENDTTTETQASVLTETENDPLGIEWFKDYDPYGPPETNPASVKFIRNYDVEFRTETIEIPVGPDEQLEYKFQMQEGQVISYSWSSGGRDMYFEFHAEPTEGEYPEGYYMSYQIGDPSTGENGSLVAPFTGNHGWYFLNLTEHALTITVEVSGYYQSHGRLF